MRSCDLLSCKCRPGLWPVLEWRRSCYLRKTSANQLVTIKFLRQFIYINFKFSKLVTWQWYESMPNDLISAARDLKTVQKTWSVSYLANEFNPQALSERARVCSPNTSSDWFHHQTKCSKKLCANKICSGTLSKFENVFRNFQKCPYKLFFAC